MTTHGSRVLGGAPLGGIGGIVGTQISGLGLRIGPLDATAYLLIDSWHLREELNGRDEADFRLVTYDAWLPVEGEEVRLTLGAARLFGGTVQSVRARFLSLRSKPDNMTDPVIIDVRCADYNQLADRFTVGEVFENMHAGDIVRALAAKYLADDGINAAGVQDGPLLSKVVCPNIKLSDVLNDLDDLTGYHWNIDDYKTLWFKPFAPTDVAQVVDETNPDIRDLEKSTTLSQFRNVQYIDGAVFLTDPRIEEFIMDGKERTKNVGFAMNSLRNVWVNGNLQTHGIGGIETGKQWYWNKTQTTITQDFNDPILPDGAILQVEYVGRYTAPALVENSDSIVSRKSVEGGSGRYEHVYRDSSLEGDNVVAEKAIGLLRRFSSIDVQLRFETERVGYAIGQTIQVNVPRFGISSGKFLVTRLDTESITTRRRFQVEVTSGELKGTGAEFFRALFNSGQKLTIRESDMVNKISVVQDTVTMTDNMTASSAAIAKAFCGSAIFGEAEL